MWSPQTEVLFDIRVIHTFYQHCTPEAVLERGFIRKQLVEDHRGHFTPSVVSVDGLRHR